jgi:hypothetical protein
MTLNQGHFKIQGKDMNFKRKFSPNDLNSIYFIELKGRFRMEIGLNFDWTWVKWTRKNFQMFLGAFLQCFENKTKAKMTYKMMKRLLMG